MIYLNRRSLSVASCCAAWVAFASLGCSASDPGAFSSDNDTRGGSSSSVAGGNAGRAGSASGGVSSSAGGAGAQNVGGTTANGGAMSSGGATSSAGAPHNGGAGGSAPNGGAGGGGAASGGASGAGSSGLGAWTTGYAATMFGNSAANDCSGYSNFSDSTNILGSTCASNKSLTIDNFQAGVANNASYYAAPGDLASIWQGPECQCQGGGTGNCPTPPSCPMEQDCGKCVAVKCDSAGTFSLGGSTHDADCNKSSYVVVEVIDACPHNHPTNVASSEGWCTSKQANHIDLSCSALGDISTLGTSIGRDGWLNVDVQLVPCSLGLGKHAL